MKINSHSDDGYIDQMNLGKKIHKDIPNYWIQLSKIIIDNNKKI